jgi:holin-like protein
MVNTLTLFLVYQLAGELLVRALGFPIPGPVIGMALLFVTLLIKGRVGEELKTDTAALLQHLTLLFVPAASGIMLHLQRISNEWLPISVALIVSTFAGMAVTALVLKAMTRNHPPEEQS